MTEETNKRLRERFEQILSRADKKPRAIDDMEEIAPQVRDKVAQAVVEEVAEEAQEGSESSSENHGQVAPEICCPSCHGSAWYLSWECLVQGATLAPTSSDVGRGYSVPRLLPLSPLQDAPITTVAAARKAFRLWIFAWDCFKGPVSPALSARESLI